jgi:hypothetical protein
VHCDGRDRLIPFTCPNSHKNHNRHNEEFVMQHTIVRLVVAAVVVGGIAAGTAGIASAANSDGGYGGAGGKGAGEIGLNVLNIGPLGDQANRAVGGASGG